MEYTFNFPRCNKAGDPYEQFKHASGEIVEATAEIGESTKRCMMETLDIIECCEGALRYMEEESGGGMLEIAYNEHQRKNIERGYYD